MPFPILLWGLQATPFNRLLPTPPGEGFSSAMVNVLWGSFNFAIAYLLLCRVGKFEAKKNPIFLSLAPELSSCRSC
jgi:hypothetical protein